MNDIHSERKPFRLGFFLILVFGGLIVCVGIGFLLKYYGVEKEEEGRLIMMVSLAAFICAPLVIYSFIFLYDKLLRPLIFRMGLWFYTRRVKKIGLREVRRKNRVMKILGPRFVLWSYLTVMISVFLSVLIVIPVRSLFVPEGNLDSDPGTAVLMIATMIILMIPFLFLSTVFYARLFIKKKGKFRAIKYVAELKKTPTIIGRVWFRACGIERSDIDKYLLSLKRQT